MSAQEWLSVEVFRCVKFGDCSNRGVTSRDETLWVPVPGCFREVPIDRRLVLREAGGVTHFVPQTLIDEGVWTMFGGCFVWTTDSRFRVVYGDRPIAVYDRVER